jgi:phage gpG-like protein
MFEASLAPYSLGKLEKSLSRLLSRINGFQTSLLLDEIGGLIESQTRRRISTEKKDPNDAPWKPWSDSYKRTRKPKHSLLVASGSLRDSIDYILGDRKVVIGTNVNYAGYVQAARPFLGIGSTGTRSRTELINFISEFSKRELFFS